MSTPPTTVNPPSNPVKTAEKSTRGRKPGIVAKERKDIPADEMQVMVLTGKAKADKRRKREPRSTQQKEVDILVYDIFEANLDRGFENGTIADWPDLEVVDWPISKARLDDAEFLLKKAAMFYHRRIIWGERQEIEAKNAHLIDDTNSEDEGAQIPCPLNGKDHVHIPFSVTRRPKRVKA